MRKFWMFVFMLLVFVPSVMAQDSEVLAESAGGVYRIIQNGSEITLQGNSLAAPLAIVKDITPIQAAVDVAANVFVIGIGAEGESQLVSATFADLLTSSVTSTNAEEGEYFTRLVHGWEGHACVEILRENESSVSTATRTWSAEDGNIETSCDDRIQPQIEVTVRVYAEHYADDGEETVIEFDDDGRYTLLDNAESQVQVVVSEAGEFIFLIGGNEFAIGTNSSMPLSVAYSENTLTMVFPNGTYTATLQEIAGGIQISLTETAMVLSIDGECNNTLTQQNANSLNFQICEGANTLELALLADSFGFVKDTTVNSYAHYDLRENPACWIPMALEQDGQVLDAAYALMSFSEFGEAQVNLVRPISGVTAYQLDSYIASQSGRIPDAAWLVVKANGLRGQFVAFQDIAEPTAESQLCVADDAVNS